MYFSEKLSPYPNSVRRSLRDPNLSRFSIQHRLVTDGQTDRQIHERTDEHMTTAFTALA